MKNRQSIGSILVLVGSLLCFFFPFISVSCAGQKFFSVTGQQLATGSTLSVPQTWGPPQTQKLDPEPLATAAAISTLVGLVLAFLGRRLAAGTAASAAAGAVCLLALRSHLSDELQKQGQGMLKIDDETGFTLALLLMIIAAGMNAYFFFQGRRRSPAFASTPVSSNHLGGGTGQPSA